MPTQALRDEAKEWKKRSLAILRELLGALKGARKDVDKMLGGAKGAVAQIGQEADKIAKAYDRALRDDDDDYLEDSGTMDALQEIPTLEDQAEDARTQVTDALDELISGLEEVKDAVGEVAPR